MIKLRRVATTAILAGVAAASLALPAGAATAATHAADEICGPGGQYVPNIGCVPVPGPGTAQNPTAINQAPVATMATESATAATTRACFIYVSFVPPRCLEDL
jgi:hypothetical protein